MRTCSVCGVEKPIGEFHKNGKDKEGNTAYRPDCKECYTITRKIKKKTHSKFMANTKHRTGEDKTFTIQDWRAALLHFRGACAYCSTQQSRKVKLTKEHVVPVTLGGPTVRQNIIPACMSCNCSKSNEPVETWYPRQRFYSVERMELIKKWTST